MIVPTLNQPRWQAPVYAERLDIDEQGIEVLQQVAALFSLELQKRLLLAPDDAQAVWLVDRGLVRLSQGRAQDKGATCMLLESGDVFVTCGPSAWRDHMVALKPSLLFRLTAQQIEGLLTTHPALGHRIIELSWYRK
jgi:CRP-like cAMP-binding protein